MPSNISNHIDLSILGEKRGDRYRYPICNARRGVSVGEGKDGKVLLYCHANGCDVWSAVRKNGATRRIRSNEVNDNNSLEDQRWNSNQGSTPERRPKRCY
jgi:hypothetical protein